MNVAILGKKYHGLEEYLKRNNINRTYFEDLNSKNPSYNVVKIDFSDENLAIDTIIRHHKEHAFDAIFTIYEKYIVTVAKITEKIDLRGLSIESAKACTDKTIMRSKFLDAPKKISPNFSKVASVDDLLQFANKHSFPLMLKPANLAKSLLVTKNNSQEELLKNYAKMVDHLEEVYRKHSPHSERIILVEEFLEGSIHSVDAYVDNEGNPHVLPYIVDYQTGYDIGFSDNFHYSRLLPSRLSVSIQKDFIETAEIAIRSLEMKNSAAHVEIIVTKDGPRVVEIGARNGGYRERMHRLAHGIDIYGNLLNILTGQKIAILASKNEPCAVLEFFPKNPGTYKGIRNEVSLRNLKSLNYINTKYKNGQYAGSSSEGYKAACIVALHNSDHKQFEKDLEFVNNQVSIITER